MANRKKGRRVAVAAARDAGEARAMEAARRMYRLARQKLGDARDPAASKEAYEAIWKAVDEVGRTTVESVEEEDAEDDPDEFFDGSGRWKAVTEDYREYHTSRGSIRVKRKRHRAVRNGPTRCLFEERRGVMSRSTMPDLGEAILRTYAAVPGDEAAKLLGAVTGHSISPSRVKRFVVDESTAMRAQQEPFFDVLLKEQPVPEEARTVVISVDALSLHLREEGWKQATVGTLTLLDADGEPLRRGAGVHTIRIAEMPEPGKGTIMNRIEGEVGALKHKRGTAWRLWRWLRDEMKREEAPVSSWARREIEKHAEYIYNQREWTRYPEAIEANAAIGSGIVEAACKTLVTQRLKVSGATWSRNGAGGVLYLRSLLQSDRFDHAFAFRQATRYAA